MVAVAGEPTVPADDDEPLREAEDALRAHAARRAGVAA
jgi:hypothetical protein